MSRWSETPLSLRPPRLRLVKSLIQPLEDGLHAEPRDELAGVREEGDRAVVAARERVALALEDWDDGRNLQLGRQPLSPPSRDQVVQQAQEGRRPHSRLQQLRAYAECVG